MQTDNCKEREGLLSPPQTSSWWNAFGSPALTTVSLAGDSSESLAGVKVVTPETEEGVNKQISTTLITISVSCTLQNEVLRQFCGTLN